MDSGTSQAPRWRPGTSQAPRWRLVTPHKVRMASEGAREVPKGIQEEVCTAWILSGGSMWLASSTNSVFTTFSAYKSPVCTFTSLLCPTIDSASICLLENCLFLSFVLSRSTIARP